ncbi:MAG: MoaD/ThiS family protein [Arenicella sp.]
MQVTISIPTILRPLTQDQKSIQTNGLNILDAINNIDTQYTGIKDRLINAEKDEVHQFINIYVNGDDIRFADNLTTPLNNGDQITILPAVAGG